jgi:hypothetical protein
LKTDIRTRFKHKGEAIIKKNLETLEVTIERIQKIAIPKSWGDLVADDPLAPRAGVPDVVNKL